MEEKKQRPNYYILLNLSYDPIETDEAVIEAAIKKETAKWNRLANNPRRGKEATAFRSMLPDIRRVMLEDADARLAEAQNAKVLNEQEQEANVTERNERLTQALEILLSKGSINETEIKHLMNKLGVSRAEVDAALPAGIVVEEALEPFSLDEDSLLSRDKKRKIADLLKMLAIHPSKGKIPTLYDFIDLPEDASSTQILQARDAMAMDLQRRPISVEVSNRKDVCGYIKTIFESAEERLKYDNTIQRDRFSSLESMIDIAGEMGGITLQQFQLFVSKCIENGLSKQAAEKLIKSYCHEKNYLLHLVETAANANRANLVACPKCGKFNDQENTACDSCQTSLVKKCLQCQHVSPMKNLTCSNCNLSFEQMGKYEELYKRGNEAFILKNLDEAEQLFQRAAFLVKTNELKMAMEQVAERRELVEEYKKHILKAMNTKAFFKAADYINKVKLLMNIENDIVAQYEITVLGHIGEVNRRLTNIAQLIDAEKSVELLEIMELCCDSDWANSMLQTLPPSMPERFEAALEGTAVKLSWAHKEPVGSLMYKIYRKSGAAPSYAGDGELVVETASFTFSDYNTVPNERYWYSICAFRNGIESTQFLVAGPIVHYTEAVFHEPATHRQLNVLNWTAAPNTTVVLVRKEGSPATSIHDGESLYEGTASEYKDFVDDVYGNYFYTLYSRYEANASGETQVISNGVTVNINMMASSNLEQLFVVSVEDKMHIVYTDPSNGKLQINLFRSDRPFTETRGMTVNLKNLLGKYAQVQEHERKIESGSIEMADALEHQYILVVVTAGEHSLVAESVYLKKVPQISKITLVKEPSGQKLKWLWPADVEAVQLEVIDLKNKSEAPLKEIVYKDSYLQNGGYLLKNSLSDSFSATIISFYNHEETDQLIMSERKTEIFTLGKKIDISYEIVKVGLIFKKPMLKIKTTGPDLTIMPELKVCLKKGSLPLVANDGRVIEIIEGANMPASKETVLDLSLSNYSEKNTDTYIRLFFKDKEESNNFSLNPIGKYTL